MTRDNPNILYMALFKQFYRPTLILPEDRDISSTVRPNVTVRATIHTWTNSYRSNYQVQTRHGSIKTRLI